MQTKTRRLNQQMHYIFDSLLGDKSMQTESQRDKPIIAPGRYSFNAPLCVYGTDVPQYMI